MMLLPENSLPQFTANKNFNACTGSLFYAPMEGITDEVYRKLILTHYPEWDFVATDFLRIPTVGGYPDKHMIKHLGTETYNTSLQDKTIYQILTSENALTEFHVTRLAELGIRWLDINLGCPSKTVCKSKGGSYLLSDLPVLRAIIKTIRHHFPHTFTAKIRVGYQDDQNFEKILKLLAEEGVDAITIHARTREQLYKGVANWDYVKRAVQIVNIPIIGNGDIWNTADIERYFDYTNCHSVMLARSAMKAPWLAKYYKNKEVTSLSRSAWEVEKFFNLFYQFVKDQPLDEKSKGRRLKAASRYSFDDFPNGNDLKKRFLLAQEPEQMMAVLSELKQCYY